MKTYYVAGQFVASNKAVLPVDDLAILRGFGVCDIMRTFNGKPYLMDAHIQRLINSASKIGLDLPWSKKELTKIVLQTLEKNNLKAEANIRIVITGGSSTDYFYPQDSPRLIVLITDLNPLPDTWYTKGVKVITRHEERALPGAKVISYIPAAMAMQEAKKQDAVEAIYMNTKEEVLEGTTSNLFAVFKGVLVTPFDGVLNGTTRQAIISLAEDFCSIEEKPIKLKTLLTADEMFITGTNKGVVPVVQVDDTVIGTGVPGKLTQKFMHSLEQHFKTSI